MKEEMRLSDFIITFCICTTGITLLSGIMGLIFFPEEKVGYEAFFSPPLFGFLSVLCGAVTFSRKELSIRQVMMRRVLQLALIEAMVFGLNYAEGVVFEPVAALSLMMSIAVVFVAVYLVLWLNDRKSAKDFNVKLKEYQADRNKEEGFG